MAVEIKRGPKITIEIPGPIMRQLESLRNDIIIGRNRWGRPIRSGSIYQCYRVAMENLVAFLLDQTKGFGYRTAAFRINGWTDNKVELQETDNPYDLFWVSDIVEHLSDQFGFSALSDTFSNDP